MNNLLDKSDNKSWEKGVVSVYMALTVVIVMVTSTLILTDVVMRQFRSATDVEFTERAFYAASSGFERASYLIQREEAPADMAAGDRLEVESSSEIPYSEGPAEYDVTASFGLRDNRIIEASICSNGEFRDAARRLVFEEGPDC